MGGPEPLLRFWVAVVAIVSYTLLTLLQIYAFTPRLDFNEISSHNSTMHPIVHFQEETVTWGCNATPWEKRNTDQNFQAWSLTQQHIDKLDILEKKTQIEKI